MINQLMDSKKKGLKLLIIVSVFLLLTIPFILSYSSVINFSNIWEKITGRLTSGTASLNVTVNAYAPSIIYIDPISAKTLTESNSISIMFNFTVSDGNGVAYLNDSTAQAAFNMSGEITRYNTSCVAGGTVGNNKNYSCTIKVWYYDGNGAWTINTSIKDINSVAAENLSTSVTLNLLTAMTMGPSALNWAGLTLASTNSGSSNNPIIVNNTGNKASSSLNITAYDLRGETTTTQIIPAANFSVDGTTAGCSGVAMLNATGKNITGSTLAKGNNTINTNNSASGQAPLYFCLRGIPQTISSQSYSSGVNAWNVAMQ
jgi:hypothetical protein